MADVQPAWRTRTRSQHGGQAARIADVLIAWQTLNSMADVQLWIFSLYTVCVLFCVSIQPFNPYHRLYASFYPQSTCRGGVEIEDVSAPSAGEYTLNVIVDIVKGGGVHPRPRPSPAWGEFFVMMECTPESGHYHSVRTLCLYPMG